MDVEEITQAIEDRAAPDYGLWRIVITANPNARKQKYKNEDEDTQDWLEWPADSEEVARAIQSHSLDIGEKESEGDDVSRPTFVYIF